MADMPLEFGGQGHSYLIKLSCVPIGLLVFFCIEYILLIAPRLLKVVLDLIVFNPQRFFIS